MNMQMSSIKVKHLSMIKEMGQYDATELFRFSAYDKQLQTVAQYLCVRSKRNYSEESRSHFEFLLPFGY